jgi:hypothetical protein
MFQNYVEVCVLVTGQLNPKFQVRTIIYVRLVYVGCNVYS